MSGEPIAVYIHTPFCPSKCGYCDFNSYAMTGEIIERTVRAIETEIRRSPEAGRPAKTIFFGGGTPTFLSGEQLTGLLRAVLETHPPIPGAEITSEANPGTVDMPKFDAMVAAGFNRVSLGAQSFDSSDLLRLGRVHEASHVAQAVTAARKAGFGSINIDLMFALPGQSLKAWETNLDLALGLKTDHLSLYCLTIEPNTRYYRLHLRGMLDLPDDTTQVAMYEMAVAKCAEKGLAQYEISNFAKPGHESQHNLCYWRAEDYLAFGPGAVGCRVVDGQRIRSTNLKHPLGYCEAVESGANLACESDVLSAEDQAFERLMLGLRLNAGMETAGLTFDPAGLKKVRERGWIWEEGSLMGLTEEGRHFCSEVAIQLSPE